MVTCARDRLSIREGSKMPTLAFSINDDDPKKVVAVFLGVMGSHDQPTNGELMLAIQQLGVQVMLDLTQLQAQVEQNTNLEASAITLIQGIADQLAQAAGDPAAV